MRLTTSALPLACRDTAGMEMESTGGDPVEPTVLRIVPDSSLAGRGCAHGAVIGVRYDIDRIA